MGTSGSFDGSGGKDANDFRDNISEWLDTTGGPNDIETNETDRTDKLSNQPHNGMSKQAQLDLAPVIRMLLRSREDTDSPSGGVKGTRGKKGGSSSGGVTRSVKRISRVTGRAGRLTLAYSTGNWKALREAGLDYNELLSLGDPASIGIKIIEATFKAQANSTIADAEERSIVATIIEWILKQSANHPPTPDDVVRKSIETIIAETALTEASATIYAKEANFEKRRNLERQIRNLATEYAKQANLNPAGATEQQMALAIETGLRDIGRIFWGINS